MNGGRINEAGGGIGAHRSKYRQNPVSIRIGAAICGKQRGPIRPR